MLTADEERENQEHFDLRGWSRHVPQKGIAVEEWGDASVGKAGRLYFGLFG